MIAQNLPLLAAGGTAISVLFLIIAFISWLWNVFNGNQNAPGGKRQQPQAGMGGRKVDQELKAEIDRFLKNVMGQKQSDEGVEVVVVEESDQPRRSRPKPRAQPETSKRASSEVIAQVEESSTMSSPRPGGRISQRRGPGSTNLGSGVRQHVAEHMQEGRVLQQVQQHLAHGVAEKVQQDLGTFSAAESVAAPLRPARTDRPAVTAAGIVKAMRDPEGLRQAFVLNLILSRRRFGDRL